MGGLGPGPPAPLKSGPDSFPFADAAVVDTACDVVQFTERGLVADTSSRLVHRAAAESRRIRVRPSQGRGEKSVHCVWLAFHDTDTDSPNTRATVLRPTHAIYSRGGSSRENRAYRT